MLLTWTPMGFLFNCEMGLYENLAGQRPVDHILKEFMQQSAGNG